MGTITYFAENVTDAASGKTVTLELGTTGFAGNGPQLFLRLDHAEVILSHADARNFIEQAQSVGSYFGYEG